MMASAHPAASTRRLQGGRVPDFFIVGHPKSGTTALFDALLRHPRIYMSSNKEPWYFAGELSDPLPAAVRAPRPSGTGWTPRTLEQYLSLFDGAAPCQRTGEASALYLWSRTAARRIAEVQPAARIVAILREPASFLHSLHLQFVQTYIETETDLGKALSLEVKRRTGRCIPPKSYWPEATLYSEHVRYAEQLRRFHSHFPPEQVLVLIYDDFRADNDATVRTVLRFLEVDGDAPLAMREVNPSVSVRARRVHELVHTVAAGRGPLTRAVREAAVRLAPPGLDRERALAIRDRLFFTRPQPADEKLMRELRVRFRPEVEAVSEYLKRDLVALWGYGDV